MHVGYRRPTIMPRARRACVACLTIRSYSQTSTRCRFFTPRIRQSSIKTAMDIITQCQKRRHLFSHRVQASPISLLAPIRFQPFALVINIIIEKLTAIYRLGLLLVQVLSALLCQAHSGTDNNKSFSQNGIFFGNVTLHSKCLTSK